jgi:hypothetical protein
MLGCQFTLKLLRGRNVLKEENHSMIVTPRLYGLNPQIKVLHPLYLINHLIVAVAVAFISAQERLILHFTLDAVVLTQLHNLVEKVLGCVDVDVTEARSHFQ